MTWCPLIFGFTGQAFLRRGRDSRTPTLRWLAHELAEQEQTGVLDLDQIVDSLSRQRLPSGSDRLAIGALGFFERQPLSILISNMHDEDGSVRSQRLPRFQFRVAGYEGEFFKSLGGGLSRCAREMLEQRMPSARSNPEAVAQLLAGAIERSSTP